MPKMIVSIDGVVIKEAPLTKDKTTLGRRPYNDIVIDNLAVSGEHAVLQMSGGQVFLEDLNSTNGTYVNGKTVKKQALNNGDVIEVGKYSIKFVSEAPPEDGFEKTMIYKAGAGGFTPPPPPAAYAAPVVHAEPVQAAIKVLSGAAAGREMPLTKVVTTIGKPGVAVAGITRRHNSFFIHHVEGSSPPAVNGLIIGTESTPLKNGDLVELAGTRMQFVQT
jgi:hypothetical protein